MNMQDINMRVVLGGHEKGCQEESLSSPPQLNTQQATEEKTQQNPNTHEESKQTNRNASSYSEAPTTSRAPFTSGPPSISGETSDYSHASTETQNSFDNRWRLQKSDLSGVGEIYTEPKTIEIDSAQEEGGYSQINIHNHNHYDHLERQPVRSEGSGGYKQPAKIGSQATKDNTQAAQISLVDILSAREVIYAKSKKTDK